MINFCNIKESVIFILPFKLRNLECFNFSGQVFLFFALKETLQIHALYFFFRFLSFL